MKTKKRGRPPHLPKTLYGYDFIKLALKEKHPLVKTRLLGLAHLQKGKSYREISQLLNVHAGIPPR